MGTLLRTRFLRPNYYRVPLLSCQIGRHFLPVPQEHSFDDFNSPDFKISIPDDSGASAGVIKATQDILGFLVEEAKHQRPDNVNVFLGVTCDIASAPGYAPYVEFRPSPSLVQRIRPTLAHASAHSLSAHDAQVLLGKFNLLFHTVWGGGVALSC